MLLTQSLPDVLRCTCSARREDEEEGGQEVGLRAVGQGFLWRGRFQFVQQRPDALVRGSLCGHPNLHPSIHQRRQHLVHTPDQVCKQTGHHTAAGLKQITTYAMCSRVMVW